MEKLWRVLLLLAVAVSSNPAWAGDPAFGVTVAPAKSEFEVGESMGCRYDITNLSDDDVAFPAPFFRTKNPGALKTEFYLQEKILRFDIQEGTNSLVMNSGWLLTSAPGRSYPTVMLHPSDVISEYIYFMRYRASSMFTLTNPGNYTVGATLDTRACKDPQIPKGVYASPRVSFKIVPCPEFRLTVPSESPEAFANARISFYFDRLKQNKGESNHNVYKIFCTEGVVGILVELTESTDKATANRARSLLSQIHHREGIPNPPSVPQSLEVWRMWSKETGSKLTKEELLANFDSYYQ